MDESLWVKASAARLQVTPHSVLMAVYAVMLHRYFAASEFVIGTPTWARDSATEDWVGCLVNTVVVRCSLAGDPDFESLCRRVHSAFVAALADSAYPYAAAAQAWRSHTGSERFIDALFTFQRVAVPDCEELAAFAIGCDQAELKLGRLHLRNIHVPRTESEFPVDLAVCESKGRYIGYISTQRRHIPRRLGVGMAEHFVHLVRSLMVDSPWRISSGQFITPAEHETLAHWNSARGPHPDGRTLWEIFAEQAKRAPEQPALVADGTQVSYLELLARAERLACVLAGNGVGSGAVALLLPPGIDWCIAMWAAVRARRPFLPVDVADPAERLARLFSDASVECVVCDDSTASCAREAAAGSGRAARIVSVDLTSDAPRPSAPQATDVVYIVFTSGSTGRPKGVPITHANLNHLMLWLADEFGIGTDTRTLQSLPVYFDFGLEEVFSTLLFGGTLYMTRTMRQLDPDDYIRQIKDHRITMAYWTPSMAAALISCERTMDTLRVVLLGGERLDRGLAAKLRQLVVPQCRIFNGYGPTEAAINSSMLEIKRADDFAEFSSSIPIGGPSGQTKLYVVNPAGSLAPLFTAGELWIGGAGVASGYLGRPELTAERFVSNELDQSGVLLYRTGDRVRWVPGGALEFLGRSDDQVKLRGHRIELAEIEQVIESVPGVVAAAVVATPMGASAVLVAFLSATGQAAAAAKVQVARLLPRHMIPSRWILLDSLPRTPNEKIDKALLSKMSTDTLKTSFGESPRDDVEYQIWRVWEEELGAAPASTATNFFESGGHSLASIAVQRKLERRLGRSIPVSWMFEYPTVETLASRLRLTEARECSDSLVAQRTQRLRAVARTLRKRS